MPEESQAPRLSCPACHETVLPEDKFCFHCGRRLKPKDQLEAAAVPEAPSRRKHFPQWPLAVAGVVLLGVAAYVVHHQSVVIAHLRQAQASNPALSKSGKHALVLHPVVTTTTTYPGNVPSSAGWTPEVETYQNVQFGLRVPPGMNSTISASAAKWVWGEANSPNQVVLQVVSNKAPNASVSLGPKTWGTPISRGSQTATQDLYINWSGQKWVEVSMTVPVSHVDWLGAIAKSVQVS